MATFTNLPVTRSIINHKENLKPQTCTKYVPLKNVIELSAPSQISLDDQARGKFSLFCCYLTNSLCCFLLFSDIAFLLTWNWL